MKKLLTILIICLLLCGCNNKPENNKSVDLNAINIFNYDNIKQFEFDLHSQEYMLVRMSDLNVLYSKYADKKIYPASLTN